MDQMQTVTSTKSNKEYVKCTDAYHSVANATHDISFSCLFSFRLSKSATQQEAMHVLNSLYESMTERVRNHACYSSEDPVVDQPEPTLSEDDLDPQAKRRKLNEQNLAEKPAVREAREKAGEYIMTFGIHKNKPIKELPIDYIRWILGVRQEGRNFLTLPPSKSKAWLLSDQIGCVYAARQFMTWTCWACGSQDTRYKNAKLCTSCWHTLG